MDGVRSVGILLAEKWVDKVIEVVRVCDRVLKLSLYKRDSRAILLYVQNSDDFHIYFSSAVQATRFYNLMCEMVDNENQVTDTEEPDGCYEYEYDDKNRKIVLGRGSFGVVYTARNKNTQVRIAVKEVPEKNLEEVQPLHEEIKLHSHLSHKNIVKYLGSVSEDGFFKIFMEQVPGGSLSQLLRSKWGPLKDAEPTIVFYTKQILEGLKYLHDNKIVHRDIKGDNVLVNTYSGVLKISDFGTSKRLAGINRNANTLAGTMQYMAPEVIDKGVRGYGPPADVWSFGCTVIEMATGKLPFNELGVPQAAMFKVGFYKIHPEIPESMSDQAKLFIGRCFVADPEKRATCDELRKHQFLATSKKKKSASEIDYNRSTSVPNQKGWNKVSTRLSSQKTPPSSSNENLRDIETPEESSVQLHRSTSSTTSDPLRDDALCSQYPPSPNNATSSYSSKFYLLLKDSEQREKLLNVLNTDHREILEKWYETLKQENHNTKLTEIHLEILLSAILENIRCTASNDPVVEIAAELRKELELDSSTLIDIQRSFCLLQEIVTTRLKCHKIQPHWVFAFDNFLREAITSTSLLLSPGSASAAESLSTHATSKKSPSCILRSTSTNEAVQQMRDEIQKLLKQLLDTLSSLHQTFIDWKMQQEKHNSANSVGKLLSPSVAVDPQLVKWLKQCQVDEDTIKHITYEEYSYIDFVEMVTLEELHGLNIKKGIVYRIWRSLTLLRKAKKNNSSSHGENTTSVCGAENLDVDHKYDGSS
ncbi:mitogen-activated protein kinase kinase kinase 5 [Octopus vulgaris]|uniref:mitogen-activated protein kinase kinase kinase n=1 Tax=Octopus vulgaris TaxID=6645 RepID=A0AA36EY79_OCTVU|nr:mitogen-activated protein kinase kinase kinase 5 [Octopus vulgaris]